MDAAIHWLAETEHFLRDPSRELHYGVTWELLNHVYNWHLLSELMPAGRPGLMGMLDEIKSLAETGDHAAIPGAIEQIKEMLDGNEELPMF